MAKRYRYPKAVRAALAEYVLMCSPHLLLNEGEIKSVMSTGFTDPNRILDNSRSKGRHQRLTDAIQAVEELKE